jgi:hypothetical protein
MADKGGNSSALQTSLQPNLYFSHSSHGSLAMPQPGETLTSAQGCWSAHPHFSPKLLAPPQQGDCSAYSEGRITWHCVGW